MKKPLFFIIAACLAALSGCQKEPEIISDAEFKIDGLTVKNFPKIDGSTSNEPLMRIIACKLLDYDYRWDNANGFSDTYTIVSDSSIIYQLAKTSQTHNSILNLIDGTAELVFSARTQSPDEKQYAENKNVTLIETPIALDAFIMLVNNANPVNSLTHKQIVDIYTKNITNWNEVGGNSAAIQPFIRNQNSGSQELMETLVMQGTPLANFPAEMIIPGMFPVFNAVRYDKNAICYIVYYYKEKQVVEEWRNSVKTLAINGIAANSETIKNGTYPFISPVYAMIRSDLNKNSTAYKLYELLQTQAGKAVIEESGYVVK